MKKKTCTEGFGERLTLLRKARGLTQKRLGEMTGVSNRVIAYYEKETDYPPSHLIVPLAEALEITTDELLGRKKGEKHFSPDKAALWKKLKIVENFPVTDQRAILHYIRMVAKYRGIV